jgi:hypothetical protein
MPHGGGRGSRRRSLGWLNIAANVGRFDLTRLPTCVAWFCQHVGYAIKILLVGSHTRWQDTRQAADHACWHSNALGLRACILRTCYFTLANITRAKDTWLAINAYIHTSI